MNTQKLTKSILVVLVFVALIALFVFSQRKENVVTIVPPPPAPTGECTIVPTGVVTIRSRPSIEADIFGTLSVGDEQRISAITENGWYAFDPASAQAANVGVFRNRYIAPGGTFTTKGNCVDLQKVVTLPATTCFDMAQMDTPIYTTFDGKSPILATIPAGGYVQAIGVHRISTDYTKYFVEASTDAGTLPPGITGWIHGGDVNFNGHCDKLPNK